MSKYWGWLLLCLIILLTACGAQNNTGDPYTDSSFVITGFITQKSDAKLLVADIFLSTQQGTKYETDKGGAVPRKDLEAGMKVKVLISGPILESYPAQAKAAEVIILTDEESRKESEVVKILLKDPKIGSQVIVHEMSWLNESTAEIKYTDTLLDRKKAVVEIAKKEILLIEAD